MCMYIGGVSYFICERITICNSNRQMEWGRTQQSYHIRTGCNISIIPNEVPLELPTSSSTHSLHCQWCARTRSARVAFSELNPIQICLRQVTAIFSRHYNCPFITQLVLFLPDVTVSACGHIPSMVIYLLLVKIYSEIEGVHTFRVAFTMNAFKIQFTFVVNCTLSQANCDQQFSICFYVCLHACCDHRLCFMNSCNIVYFLRNDISNHPIRSHRSFSILKYLVELVSSSNLCTLCIIDRLITRS